MIRNSASATSNSGENAFTDSENIQTGNASASAESTVITNGEKSGVKVEVKAEANGKKVEVKKEIDKTSENIQVKESTGDENSQAEANVSANNFENNDIFDIPNNQTETTQQKDSPGFFIVITNSIKGGLEKFANSILSFFS